MNNPYINLKSNINQSVDFLMKQTIHAHVSEYSNIPNMFNQVYKQIHNIFKHDTNSDLAIKLKEKSIFPLYWCYGHL